MKKILCLMVALVCLVGAFTGCDDGEKAESGTTATQATEGGSKGEAKTNGSAAESAPKREPMPAYGKIGVNNTVATSDGRYIYYVYTVEDENEGALFRRDMDFGNPQELNAKTRRKFYNLFIDEGYMYLSAGRSAERVDIATGPDYFNGADGRINLEPIFDDDTASELMGVSHMVTDGEYLYFESTGINRVKKDKTGFEQIAYGEDFVNFYDLKYWNGKIYAYCGDDQKLYRIAPDGSSVEEVCKMMESYVVYEGNAYYIFSGDNHAQQLTKTNLETGATETIATLGEGWVSADLKNAMDGKIYYVFEDENDVCTIRSYDIASGDVKEICAIEGKTETIDIVNDFLFYDQDETLMKINTDGTNKEQLEK